MTLTLNISPKLEARLAAEALARKIPVEKLVTQALETFVQMPDKASRTNAKRDAIRAARGSMSRYPTTINQFLAEKRAGVEREA